MGRQQMENHDFQESHSFKDVYLIDFVEMPLKSRHNYEML